MYSPHQFTALSPSPKYGVKAKRELYISDEAFARFTTCLAHLDGSMADESRKKYPIPLPI